MCWSELGGDYGCDRGLWEHKRGHRQAWLRWAARNVVTHSPFSSRNLHFWDSVFVWLLINNVMTAKVMGLPCSST